MKILIITTQVPFPPYRGDRVRIYNISKELLKKNEVKILTFRRSDSESENINVLKNNGFDVEAIDLPYYKSLLNLYRSLFNSIPLQVSAFHSAKMATKIAQLTSTNNYDVIYFNHLVTAQYLNSTSNSSSLKVIDFTDATSLYLTRLLGFLDNSIKKLLYKIELQRIINYEKISPDFDTLFICSSVDKKFLEEKDTHENIRLLINGIDLKTFRYEKLIPEKNRIIFAGNMQYYPNVDAVLYFTNEIFPIILEQKPLAKFYIVGQNPPQSILKLQNSNIIVKGFVDDIRMEYLLSEVNVAPLRLGSGTPYKTIEALALGLPTISSVLSAAGLPTPLQKFVQTADDPIIFAEKVLGILSNNKFKEELIKDGIVIIKDILNWENIVKNFEDYLAERIKSNKKAIYE